MNFSPLLNRPWITRWIVALTFSSVLLSGQAAPRPHFHVLSLGTLPGGQVVQPVALNNHGDVVGMASSSNGVYRPFHYRNGVMAELAIGDGPSASGVALDINDAGQIVAQATVTNFFHGYLITPEDTLDLDAQTGLNVWPVGINRFGMIAANIPRGFASEAVTWSNGVVRFLGFLDPTNGSYALDINDRGDVLATVFVGSPPPFPSRFTAVFHDGLLSVLGTFYGEALNNRGAIAGESEHAAGLGAILVRDGTTLDLGTLPGDSKSHVSALNNSGQVVGISEGASERYLAFLYTDGVMYDLNDLIPPRSGWILSTVQAMNDRGQIVGVGYLHGEERAFLLTPAKKPKDPPDKKSPLQSILPARPPTEWTP
jgi:probable HAF family extracellular repeat protein